RALERDEDIPGPLPGLERGRPALVQVRCVVACRQRVAVQGIDPLPHLPLQGTLPMPEVNGRRLRARVQPDGSRVEGLAVLGPDLEAVAGKREPMSDHILAWLFPGSDPAEIESHFKSHWDRLNRCVHPSGDLRLTLVGASALHARDAFDEGLA